MWRKHLRCQTSLSFPALYRLFCRYLIKTWDWKKSYLFCTLSCIFKAYVFWPRKFLGWFLIWSNYSCITAQGNRSSFYKHTHTVPCIPKGLLYYYRGGGGVLLVFFFLFSAVPFLNTRHSQNSVVFYRVWLEFVCAWYIRQNFFYQTLFVSLLWISERDRQCIFYNVNLTSCCSARKVLF